MQEQELKKVELDELELYLNLLKANDSNLINNMSSVEIAKLIETQFKIKCSDKDIFLIHEPTLAEDTLDILLHHKILFG